MSSARQAGEVGAVRRLRHVGRQRASSPEVTATEMRRGLSDSQVIEGVTTDWTYRISDGRRRAG
mgnify:CR=1 FL=1